MKRTLYYFGSMFLVLFFAFMVGYLWKGGPIYSVGFPVFCMSIGVVLIFVSFVHRDEGPIQVKNLPKDTVFRIVKRMGTFEHEEDLGEGRSKLTTHYLYLVSRQGAGSDQGMKRFVFVRNETSELEKLDEFVVCSHSSLADICKYKPQMHIVLSE